MDAAPVRAWLVGWPCVASISAPAAASRADGSCDESSAMSGRSVSVTRIATRVSAFGAQW